MDSCLSKPLHLFLLTLAFLCYLICADLINDICSQTKNPSLCSSALRSDHRSSGADLKLLGQISIDVTSAGAKSGAALVTKLGKGATDPKLKEIYNTCSENYGDSLDNLRDCGGMLNSGDYKGMNYRASAADTDVDTCDDAFGEFGQAEPSELKAASKNVQDLCSAILVISNRLH